MLRASEPPELGSGTEIIMPVRGIEMPAGVVDIEDKVSDAKNRSDEDLVKVIVGMGSAYRDFKCFFTKSRPYIVEARARFAQQGRRVPVEGKPTWEKFVTQNFGVSDRYVRRLLQEPPSSRAQKANLVEGKRTKVKVFELAEHKKRVPRFWFAK